MILVVDILPNSGVGGEAGLKKGDVLLAIQGRKVEDMSAYRSYQNIPFGETGSHGPWCIFLIESFQGSTCYACQRRGWRLLC